MHHPTWLWTVLSFFYERRNLPECVYLQYHRGYSKPKTGHQLSGINIDPCNDLEPSGDEPLSGFVSTHIIHVAILRH